MSPRERAPVEADLGVAGRRVLVTGAARGIGRAMAMLRTDGDLAAVRARIPCGRLGGPDGMAATVAVLLGLGSCVKGRTLPVDGGPCVP